MSTAPVGIIGQQGSQATAGLDPWGNVDLNDFIRLLVVELRNQDPLEPMNNQEILQQISQIREIESNDRLSTTLSSVLLGQNVSTAGNMLGRVIKGLSDAGKWTMGQVDRVTITGGVAKVHVGDHTIDLKNVSEILPEDAEIEDIVGQLVEDETNETSET